jgi:predicted RNase H-like nuclease (RuvC/YqgF family)
MKKASILVVLIAAVCLVGCENKDLATCQQEKQTLQQQIDQAQAAIAEKDKKMETMKAENTEMQTKAMESIKTMMEKQAAQDNKLKQKLIERAQQIKDLEEKVASLEKQIAGTTGTVSEAAPAVEAPAQ